jgi:hypothetical protein
LTFRCKKCHSAVWVQPADREGSSARASCRGCGQDYRLEAWADAGGEPALAAKARRLAKEQALDLPSAYTVALGLATADDMRELGDAGSTACRTARNAGEAPRQPDDGFEGAIEAGHLTGRQAAERGNRDGFATKVASRHGLPMSVARDIADNKISLLQAIRERAKRERKHGIEVRSRRVRTWALAAGLVLVAGLAVLTSTGRQATLDHATIDRTLDDAEVRTAGDVVLQITGPDPRTVLRAYCTAASRGARLEPLAVVPSSLPGARARIGLLRDPRRPDDLLAITIREDPEAGLWRAGEDGKPVLAEPAPTGAEGAVRQR